MSGGRPAGPPTGGGLTALGWGSRFEALFVEHAAAGRVPARVTAEHRGALTVDDGARELAAAISGRLRFDAAAAADLPAVGDWVAIDPRPGEDTATVQAVLPRRSAITRDGGTEARRGGLDDQVLAANVDVALVVAPVDRPVNLRRLERTVALAWAGGTEPVIVLSKADLAPNPGRSADAAARVAPGVAVHVVSALDGSGIEALDAHLAPARTAVLLGASGAGKSTLVNALLGRAALATAAVRADDGRGRHTTTHRQLLALPGGALLIDTPGLRALGLVDLGDGLGAVFEDVEALAAACRFGDCSHETEPGCAVRAALGDGSLDGRRFEAYRKLLREQAHAARERDPRLRLAERRRWRQISVAVNRHMAAKYGDDWR